LPEISWKKEVIPQQVVNAVSKRLYFKGDLLHKALLSHAIPSLAVSMLNLRSIELFYAQNKNQTSLLSLIFSRCILEPLGRLMYFLHELNEKWD
jgi:hypothetical protein